MNRFWGDPLLLSPMVSNRPSQICLTDLTRTQANLYCFLPYFRKSASTKKRIGNINRIARNVYLRLRSERLN